MRYRSGRITHSAPAPGPRSAHHLRARKRTATGLGYKGSYREKSPRSPAPGPLAGCSKGSKEGEKLPEGKDLLEKSAKAMEERRYRRLHARCQRADLGAADQRRHRLDHQRRRAKATAHLNQGDRVVEYEYVQVDGQPT